MYSVETTTRVRRFTIFDGTLLVLVLAPAFLSARTSLPDATKAWQAIDYSSLVVPIKIRDELFGEHYLPRMDSIQVLMTSGVLNALRDPVQDRREVEKQANDWLSRIGRSEGRLLFALRRSVVLAFPLLVYASFALLILRVIPPRPGIDDVLRQPGCAACQAIVGSLVAGSWLEMVGAGKVFVAVVAVAVGGVWIGLALRGASRPEKSWIDRAGRLLGVIWLLAGIVAIA